MKTSATPKPTWMTLYSIGAMGMAALFFVPSLQISPLMQRIDMFLIMAALYGAIAMWISANRYAIQMEDFEQHAAEYRIRWDILGASVAQDSTTPKDPTENTNTHQEVA